MKLRQYAAERALSAPQVRQQLQLRSVNSVYRYYRGDAIPIPPIMRRIYCWSHGAVTPNDFYDLPVLAAPGSTITESREVAQ
jgi:hypothetical protein